MCLCTHVHVYVITGSPQGLHHSPVDIHSPVIVFHWLYFLWCPTLSSLKESFLLIITRALGARAVLATWGPLPIFIGFSRKLTPTRSPILQIPEGPKSGYRRSSSGRSGRQALVWPGRTVSFLICAGGLGKGMCPSLHVTRETSVPKTPES